MLSDRCPVSLFATLVYCGQTVGWIKMPLGTEVGLGPGDIVLDEDPAHSLPKGMPPLFGPCLWWPNGWIDQDTTWYRGRPRPRGHCVRWRPSFLHRKGQSSPPNPLHCPCLLWPNGRPSQQLLSSCYFRYSVHPGPACPCGPVCKTLGRHVQ